MSQKKEPFIPINKGQFSLETKNRIEEFDKKRGFGVENDYKLNREQWEKFAKDQYVSEYPLHVDIELASICNLRCPMCYTISPEFRKKVNAKLMDWDLFKKIIDEIAPDKVFSIRLSYRGESFLHPKFVDCVKYAKKKGIKEVSSLTNGARVDDEMFIELMEAGMDWITFSIDGVGEVYEKIRSPIKFDELVNKITSFKKIKEMYGFVKPVIKVQTILPAIEKNPKEFYDIFAPICDMVSSNPLIDFMESKKDLPKLDNFSCPQVFQRLVIGADGLCMMCANDENGDFEVGNANTQSIFDIWHGPQMNIARNAHKKCTASKELGPCSECYLPIKTFNEQVFVGDRYVVAEKYKSSKQRVSNLKTPKRWQKKIDA